MSRTQITNKNDPIKPEQQILILSPSSKSRGYQKNLRYKTIDRKKKPLTSQYVRSRKTFDFAQADNYHSTIQDKKQQTNSYKNASHFVNFEIDDSLFPVQEFPTKIMKFNQRKKTYLNHLGKSIINSQRTQYDQEYSPVREPYTLMKKGKCIKMITKIKCPYLQENSPIKKYMKIERIKFPSPQLELKNKNKQQKKKFNQTNFIVSKSLSHPKNTIAQLELRKQLKEDFINHKRVSSLITKSQIDVFQKLKDSSNIKTRKRLLQQFNIRKPVLRKDYFVFGMSDRASQQSKTQNFRDFLWKINYSNSLYVYTPEEINKPYKFYLGYGNNYHLIKGMMKKRFWWVLVDKPEQANFVWTQLKQNNIYKLQENGKIQHKHQISPKQQQIVRCDSPMKKIWNDNDFKNWQKFMKNNSKTQEKISQKTYIRRLSLFKHKRIKKISQSKLLCVHNHLQSNFYIGNKKALFYCMRQFLKSQDIDPFTILPLTFHITKGVQDPEFKIFQQYYNQIQANKQQNKSKNVWIVKPGQNTNRGNGITVCYSLDDIIIRLKGREKNNDGKLRTFILQKYIQNPLLYNKRKFDIRHYMLITCINGGIKGYWFEQGYLRTASGQFSLKYSKDPYAHLTNDAIQKNGQNYGKFQKGNKLSYAQFQKYIDSLTKNRKVNFFQYILPKMKQIGTQSIKATYHMLDKNKKQHNFQLLGFDFMIDDDFKPWLIEVNTNPCLETSSSILQKIIPQLIDNTLKLSLDPLFPPPQHWQSNKKVYFGDNAITQNKFQLVFDEVIHGRQINQMVLSTDKQLYYKMGKVQEDAQIFQDDGDENWQQK